MKLSGSITIAIAAIAVICILAFALIIKYLYKHRQAKESDPESDRKALQGFPDPPAHAVPLQCHYRDGFGILGSAQIARRYMEERKITEGWHRTSWGVPFQVVVNPKPDDRIRAVIIPAEVDESEHDRLKREWPPSKVYTDNCKDCQGGPATGLPKEIIATLV